MRFYIRKITSRQLDLRNQTTQEYLTSASKEPYTRNSTVSQTRSQEPRNSSLSSPPNLLCEALAWVISKALNKYTELRAETWITTNSKNLTKLESLETIKVETMNQMITLTWAILTKSWWLMIISQRKHRSIRVIISCCRIWIRDMALIGPWIKK